MLAIFGYLVALGFGLFVVWNIIIPLILTVLALAIGGLAFIFGRR